MNKKTLAPGINLDCPYIDLDLIWTLTCPLSLTVILFF